MIKICAISDLHGNLDIKINESDVLCICGDIVPLNKQTSSKESLKWIETEFIPWCKRQPCKEVLLIAGNHDFVFERSLDKARELFKGTNIRYLQDEAYFYIKEDGSSLNFYGTPWCHQFGNWAFMGHSDDELAEIFMKMPDDVDVLLTHDCPYGACDVLLQNVWWANGEHIGGKGLTKGIEARSPKMNLTGHLHSTNKKGEMLGNTFVCNVSVLNENYKLVYEPHYFIWNDDKTFEQTDN